MLLHTKGNRKGLLKLNRGMSSDFGARRKAVRRRRGGGTTNRAIVGMGYPPGECERIAEECIATTDVAENATRQTTDLQWTQSAQNGPRGRANCVKGKENKEGTSFVGKRDPFSNASQLLGHEVTGNLLPVATTLCDPSSLCDHPLELLISMGTCQVSNSTLDFRGCGSGFCLSLPEAAQQVTCSAQNLNIYEAPSIYNFNDFASLWQPITCLLWNVTYGSRQELAGKSAPPCPGLRCLLAALRADGGGRAAVLKLTCSILRNNVGVPLTLGYPPRCVDQLLMAALPLLGWLAGWRRDPPRLLSPSLGSRCLPLCLPGAGGSRSAVWEPL